MGSCISKKAQTKPQNQERNSEADKKENIRVEDQKSYDPNQEIKKQNNKSESDNNIEIKEREEFQESSKIELIQKKNEGAESPSKEDINNDFGTSPDREKDSPQGSKRLESSMKDLSQLKSPKPKTRFGTIEVIDDSLKPISTGKVRIIEKKAILEGTPNNDDPKKEPFRIKRGPPKKTASPKENHMMLKRIIDCVNDIRQNPVKYCQKIQFKIDEESEKDDLDTRHQSERMIRSLIETKNYLSVVEPAQKLILDIGLTAAAFSLSNNLVDLDEVEVQKILKNDDLVERVSEYGSFRSGFLAQSTASFALPQPEEWIVDLIIDCDKPNLEDRINIFNQSTSQIGIGIGRPLRNDDPYRLVIITASPCYFSEQRKVSKEERESSGYEKFMESYKDYLE